MRTSDRGTDARRGDENDVLRDYFTTRRRHNSARIGIQHSDNDGGHPRQIHLRIRLSDLWDGSRLLALVRA